jgi:hypothetical protein
MLKDYQLQDIKVHLVLEDRSITIKGLDETDTIYTLKRALENEGEIPIQYQCIFFRKSGEIIGHYFESSGEPEKIIIPGNLDLSEGRPEGKLVDLTSSLIGSRLTKDTLEVINFRKYVEDELDLDWFLSLDERELQEFYDQFLIKYWPHLNIRALQMAQGRNWAIPSSEHILSSSRNILSIPVSSIKKMKNFAWTLPAEGSKKIVTKFNRAQNLVYFFDQFKLTPKYYVIIIKINEAKKFKRFLIGNKLAELTSRIPKMNGILINDSEIYIRPDGIVIHEDKDILTLGPFAGSIISQTIRSSYSFTTSLPIKLDYKIFGKLLGSYPSFIERDYKNFDFIYFVSFYYKKIDISGDEQSEYIQSGAYVKITGKTVLQVTINNIKTSNELTNIFNFLIRLFWTYIEEYRFEVSVLRDESRFKSNLKDVDWKLFSQENLYSIKHTRLCQREKQPYAFFLDSDQWDYFTKDPKNKSIVSNKLLFHNMTYPDRTSVYVCMNKHYKYPTFISSLIHKKDLCIPCCSSIDKKKSPEFQRCIGQSDIEVRESNNLYYISQFNPEKIMKRKRLSYLPELLHKFINPGMKLRTFIAPGEDLYIILGQENSPTSLVKLLAEIINIDTINPLTSKPPESSQETFENFSVSQEILIKHYLDRGINVVIIALSGELNERGDDTRMPSFHVINSFDTISMINNINNNKTIFLLQTRGRIYYPFLHIVLSKDRKYTLSLQHGPESNLSKKIVQILSKLVQIEEELPYTSYKQIQGKIPFICNQIFTGNVIIPIRPRPYNKEFEIIEEFEYENKLSDILALKPPLKTTFDLIYQDKFVGFEFESLLIFFRPEPLGKSQGTRKEIHIDSKSFDNSSQKLDQLLPIDTSSELYAIFILYLSKIINQPHLPSIRNPPKNLREWNQFLLDSYRKAGISGDSPEFLLDSGRVSRKEYEKLEILKVDKLELQSLIESKKDPSTIIRDIMRPYINFIEFQQTTLSISNIRKVCGEGSESYSVDRQCSGDLLNLTRETFDKFCRLAGWELSHNELRRRLIFDNILPIIVSSGHFSYQKDTRVIKLD